MRQLSLLAIFGGFIVSLTSASVVAQTAFTTLTGGSLVLRSRQTQSNTLDATGYLGTYITVPAGGATIDLRVNTTGGGGHVNLVVADSKFGFNVSGTQDHLAQNISLPGGSYLVRAERDYGSGNNQSFGVNSLSVRTLSTVVATSGAAAFANHSPNGTTAGQAAANAMAAADTYINNFRKGSLDLAVQGIAPGTQVQVRLKNSAFKFGTAVPSPMSNWLAATPVGNTATQYQQKLLQNFNSITPENGGKWSESDTDFQLRQTDRALAFADKNGLRFRQHGLIWSTQQSAGVANLFPNARSTDPAVSGPAKAAIQNLINGRIAKYVGGTNQDAQSGGKIRATQYDDLDVYNESWNTGENAARTTNLNYWKVLGATEAEGAAITADIYNRTQAAVTAAGANTKLFTNDYNIFNNSASYYGQWYTQHVEKIRMAGGKVSGIGAQFYADAGVGSGGASVDPFRVAATLANLSTQGLPIELTEFGTRVESTAGGAAAALTAATKLSFGQADVAGFTLWGFFEDRTDMFDGAKGSVLYKKDASGNLVRTLAGEAYENLHAQWTTNVTTTINADGRITLPNGAFYGNYEVTLKGVKYELQYDKGTNSHLLVVLKGDFNNDEARDGNDIDALLDAVQGSVPTADGRFDMNGDGAVISTINDAASDTDYFVRVTEGSEYGDANFDGKVDFQDLVALAQNYNQSNAGWADGNFNGDDAVNFQDLVTLAQNYGFGSTPTAAAASFADDWALAQAIAAIPEPTMLLPLAGTIAVRRRRVGAR